MNNYQTAISKIGEQELSLQGFLAFIGSANILGTLTGTLLALSMTSLINSVVDDVLTPMLKGLINMNSKTSFYVLRRGKQFPYTSYEDALADDTAIVIKYGDLLQNVLQFIIQAILVFLCMKVVYEARQRLEKSFILGARQATV